MVGSGATSADTIRKATDAPGEVQSDLWIASGLFHRLRELA